jgi:hypothetical protein
MRQRARAATPGLSAHSISALAQSLGRTCAEDGELHIILTKGSKGVTWKALIRGHTEVDPYTQSELQKSLMLERFQQEVCPAARCLPEFRCRHRPSALLTESWV